MIGGEFNKVRLVEIEPGNNDFIAIEDIAKGDVIAYIPSDMLMTRNEAAANSPTFKFVEENQLHHRMGAVKELLPLMFYIMEERRNPASKWKNYLETLPKDWSNLPMFYTEEDLTWFLGT